MITAKIALGPVAISEQSAHRKQSQCYTPARPRTRPGRSPGARTGSSGGGKCPILPLTRESAYRCSKGCQKHFCHPLKSPHETSHVLIKLFASRPVLEPHEPQVLRLPALGLLLLQLQLRRRGIHYFALSRRNFIPLL